MTRLRIIPMDSKDLVELADNIQQVAYHDWLVIVDGLLYHTCYECGASTLIMFRNRTPSIQEFRFLVEPELTAVVRSKGIDEPKALDLPLYRELVALREENAQLKHRVDELTGVWGKT